MDNRCATSLSARSRAAIHDAPALGPVEEIVVNDKPLDKGSSLCATVKNKGFTAGGGFVVGYSRAELLQLVSSFALSQLHTLLQLFLQPRKVPHERRAVSDKTRAEALNLRCVLDSLEVRNRGVRDGYVGQSNRLGDCRARFIADQTLCSACGSIECASIKDWEGGFKKTDLEACTELLEVGNKCVVRTQLDLLPKLRPHVLADLTLAP